MVLPSLLIRLIPSPSVPSQRLPFLQFNMDKTRVGVPDKLPL